MEYIVQRYKEIDGYKVLVEYEHNVTLQDIEKLVKEPIIDSLDNYANYNECKRSQYGIFWGERIDNSKSEIKCNFGDRCAIVLDYDDGYTIEMFNTKFSGKFKYYIYTSIKHKPEAHRFRVIIPTTNKFKMTAHLCNVLIKCFPYTTYKENEYGRNTEEIIAFGVDRTTHSNRKFYVPVKVNNYYRYYISEGSVFDIDKRLGKMIKIEQDNWIAKIKKDEQDRKDREAERIALGIPDATIERRKESYIEKHLNPKMDSISWGRDGSGRHGVLGNAMDGMGRMNFDGDSFTNDEIYDAIHPYLIDKKHINQLETYLRNRR